MNVVQFKMDIVHKNDHVFFPVPAFNVPYVDTFEMFRQLGVRFS